MISLTGILKWFKSMKKARSQRSEILGPNDHWEKYSSLSTTMSSAQEIGLSPSLTQWIKDIGESQDHASLEKNLEKIETCSDSELLKLYSTLSSLDPIDTFQASSLHPEHGAQRLVTRIVPIMEWFIFLKRVIWLSGGIFLKDLKDLMKRIKE